MSFQLEVITPEKMFFQGEVKKLTVPSITGQLTILTHHLPIFTLLDQGKIKITDLTSKVHQLIINKGMIQVQKQKVIVLIEPFDVVLGTITEQAIKAKKRSITLQEQKLEPKAQMTTNTAFQRSFLDLKDVKKKRLRLSYQTGANF